MHIDTTMGGIALPEFSNNAATPHSLPLPLPPSRRLSISRAPWPRPIEPLCAVVPLVPVPALPGTALPPPPVSRRTSPANPLCACDVFEPSRGRNEPGMFPPIPGPAGEVDSALASGPNGFSSTRTARPAAGDLASAVGRVTPEVGAALVEAAYWMPWRNEPLLEATEGGRRAVPSMGVSGYAPLDGRRAAANGGREGSAPAKRGDTALASVSPLFSAATGTGDNVSGPIVTRPTGIGSGTVGAAK